MACTASIPTEQEATVEAPAQQETTVESPATESSALRPVTSTPVPEVDEQPTSGQPAAEQPAAEQPAAEQPKAVKGLDANDGRVIVYKQSGGIAGISDEWIIYDDGTMIAPDGKEYHVDAQQVQAIVDMSGTMSSISAYGSLDNCCDLMTYTITIYAGGETRSISTNDGAKQPPEVTAVFDELGQLIAVSRQ